MKKRLLILLLIGVLVLSYGCGRSPHSDATADTPTSSASPTETSTVAPVEVTTTAATQPTTQETQPPTITTAPTQTIPPTEPPKPTASKPKPTEPAATTPKPTVPAQPATPMEPTRPNASNWLDKDGKRYYLNDDGSVHTGWLTLDGDRYYFHEDGTMAVGKVKVPGSGTRYFTSTGKECILVNPWNYVPSDYTVKLSKYGERKVATVCLEDLKDMLADCKKAGSTAVINSAYRSHSYQQTLFDNRVQQYIDQGYSRKKAEEETAKRVAVPGTSEHELGLAVDISDASHQSLDSSQEDTHAQKWLIANSWKYGFILRYPNGKSDVTGIIYEPWHYRYVGKELAKELHETGLCLEEYFAQLS